MGDVDDREEELGHGKEFRKKHFLEILSVSDFLRPFTDLEEEGDYKQRLKMWISQKPSVRCWDVGNAQNLSLKIINLDHGPRGCVGAGKLSLLSHSSSALCVPAEGDVGWGYR